jgi:hypothetical protein
METKNVRVPFPVRIVSQYLFLDIQNV